MTEPTDAPKANLSNWRQAPFSRHGFTHVDSFVPVARFSGADGAFLPEGPKLDLSRLAFGAGTAEGFLNETATDAFLLLKDGVVRARHLAPWFQPDDRHIIFSVSKSLTAFVAGILIGEGLLDPARAVIDYVPEAAGSAYGTATVRHVLDMTVSIRFVEDYDDPLGDVARYRVAMGWNPPGAVPDPGGLHAFLLGLPKGDGPHGHRFHYVSPNSDLLGLILERASGERMADLIERRLWMPMGARLGGFFTIDRHGAARTAGGICVGIDDLARLGELMRLDGKVQGRQIVPKAFIDDIMTAGDPEVWARGEMTGIFPDAHCRSKWYVPRDRPQSVAAIGIHGQFIHVDRASGTVAVKMSSHPVAADEAVEHRTIDFFRTLADCLD